MSTSAQSKINGRAGRCSKADESIQIKIISAGFTGRPDNIHNVIFHPIIDINVVYDVASGDDLFRIDNGVDLQIGRRRSHEVENATLLGFLRITDIQFEHETVELRFG